MKSRPGSDIKKETSYCSASLEGGNANGPLDIYQNEKLILTRNLGFLLQFEKKNENKKSNTSPPKKTKTTRPRPTNKTPAAKQIEIAATHSSRFNSRRNSSSDLACNKKDPLREGPIPVRITAIIVCSNILFFLSNANTRSSSSISFADADSADIVEQEPSFNELLGGVGMGVVEVEDGVGVGVRVAGREFCGKGGVLGGVIVFSRQLSEFLSPLSHSFPSSLFSLIIRACCISLSLRALTHSSRDLRFLQMTSRSLAERDSSDSS